MLHIARPESTSLAKLTDLRNGRSGRRLRPVGLPTLRRTGPPGARDDQIGLRRRAGLG